MAPRASSALRREQLLAATAKVLSERGVAETRLADVAQELGISPALIVYYFKSRHSLLMEALRYSESCFYAAVFAHVKDLPGAREKLRAIVRVTCSPEPTMGLPAGWALWFELWPQAMRHPQAARDRALLDEQWRVVIADIVRAGRAAGEIGPVDADRFAQGFTALLDGLGVQVALADATVTSEQAVSLADEFCDVMLTR
ncbi:MAG: TetR family transcriptional regulator C-terminal domain-containing protein [Nakamurella sp.]